MEGLEKELKILKLKALGTAENNIWYSYRSEVHKIFSKINHILFWLILGAVSLSVEISRIGYINNNIIYQE